MTPVSHRSALPQTGLNSAVTFEANFSPIFAIRQVALGAMGKNAMAIKGMQGRSFQPEALRQPPAGGAGGPQTLTPMGQASVLRSQHLSRLATWASAAVPPLGALLGARLGCWCEAVGAPAPPSPHVTCERCESIMQVGVNCSVRITKDKKRKSTGTRALANSITYVCHFCKHGTSRAGTPQNHVKTKISQAAARVNLEMLGKSVGMGIPTEMNKLPSIDVQIWNDMEQGVKEPSRSVGASMGKDLGEKAPSSSAKKRKRKGWSSLKDLASSTNPKP